MNEIETPEIAVFVHEVSDDALEAAGGTFGPLNCSCRPCKSLCSQKSR